MSEFFAVIYVFGAFSYAFSPFSLPSGFVLHPALALSSQIFQIAVDYVFFINQSAYSRCRRQLEISRGIGYLFGRPGRSKLLLYVRFNLFTEVCSSVAEPLSAFGFSLCGSGIIIKHPSHELPAIPAYLS